MQLERSIVQALKYIEMPTNITPILSDRNGIEPKAPYLLIQTITTTNIGTASKSVVHEQGDVTETIIQTKDFNVALIFHADTSGDTLDWVNRFHTGLSSDLYDWAFSQQGLGVVSWDDIVYQSAPVDGKNYKRAIVGMTFRSEIVDKFTVNEMNRVEFVGDIVDELAGKVDEVVVDIPFGY